MLVGVVCKVRKCVCEADGTNKCDGGADIADEGHLTNTDAPLADAAAEERERVFRVQFIQTRKECVELAGGAPGFWLVRLEGMVSGVGDGEDADFGFAGRAEEKIGAVGTEVSVFVDLEASLAGCADGGAGAYAGV